MTEDLGVRVDMASFVRDVADMRSELVQGLGGGAEEAGRLIEGALLRSIRSGKLGFEDLKRVALGAMGQIAAEAVRGAIGGGGAGSGGLLSLATSVASAALGLPGRATGGAVSPGRAFMVGERGPELFVPTSSGQVLTASPGGARDVRVSITVNAPAGSEPQALARSGRQVARAVRAALASAGG